MLLQSDDVFTLGPESGMGPQVITSIFFILYSYTIKIKRTNIKFEYSILYIIYFVIIIYMYMCNPKSLPVLGQLFIYLFCAYRMYIFRSRISERSYVKIIYRLSLFFGFFCIAQLLSSIHILPKIILQPFFFNDPSEYVHFNKDESYFRVFGTFMEPSYCSSFLVGLIGYLYIYRDYIKSKKLIYLLCVNLVLTFSSTGYVGLVLLFLMFIICNRNVKMLKIAIPTIAVFIIFFLLTKDTLMKEIILDKMNSASGRERARWNERALFDFNHNPLTGVGFGNSRASSFAYCLLGEIGIIGTLMYTFFSAFLFLPLLKSKHFSIHEIASRYFVLGVFICMLIACPDQTLCTFWMGIYFVSLSPYIK